MINAKTKKQHYQSLLAIAMQLKNNYFTYIISTCNNIRQLCIRLNDDDIDNFTTIYNNFCLNMLSEIQHNIEFRAEKTIPYISQLTSKLQVEQDSCECSGNCDKELEQHITEIENSQYKIRDLFFRLQKIAPPVYSVALFPELYKSIRVEMEKLNNIVSELFYIEESSLIPGLQEAQNKLHAVNRD